ncbi:MAG TPA: ABC transporter substrate-binding protein [Vicinamibacteria bacterium]|nr:ABC transporter substrate-binding protein [Vicinamibacteria bacterium]
MTTPSPPAAGGRKVLRVGILAPVNTLNPRESRDSVSTMAVSQVFETPVTAPRGEGAAVPVLFTGPLVQESPTRYSASVRGGITFSDGTPLNAAAVAGSLARVEDVKDHATVEAAGERVIFNLKSPNPRFDLVLTMVHCAIALDRGGRLLGTGAFVPTPGSGLDTARLAKNPRHREPVALDEVTFTRYPANADGRPEALMKAIEKGEVDFTNALSRTDAGEVKGVRKSFQPGNSTAILYFNTERPELKSAETRRALAMAIDRVSVTEVTYSNPLAFAATSLLPPMMGAHRDGLVFDPVKARSLFEKAPAPKPTRLRMLIVWAPRPYLPHPPLAAERIARQLKELGIEVQVHVPRASDEYFQMCARGDYDMVLGGWIADTPDPVEYLEANLRSDRIQSPSVKTVASINLGRYRSAAMDAALKRYRETGATENRAAVLNLVAEDVPLVPIMYGPTVVVSAWRVKNVEVTPMGVPNFAKFDLE